MERRKKSKEKLVFPVKMPADFPKLLNVVIQAKLKGLSARQKQSWWDCFVECLNIENAAVKNCVAACASVCAATKFAPACGVCIIGCGGIAWYKIIKCAWECS